MYHIYSDYLSASHEPLAGERTCLYDAALNEWRFCHHPALGAFGNRLFAMWSNGPNGEDELGQRVMYASSEDGRRWSTPRILCEAFEGRRMQRVLTAAGFHACGGKLAAYIGAYEYRSLEETTDRSGRTRQGRDCVETALYAMVTQDGEHFCAPMDLQVPICPNYGPQPLQSGRLLLTGNWAHAYTDDPFGLTGWTLRGFCRDTGLLEKPVRDDPSYFWRVSRAMGLEGALCEGAYLQGADGVIHMLHRSYGQWLFESDSADGGETWSHPEMTRFPNGNSKFFLGRLPDGRCIYIGNPALNADRCPLVLSIAEADMRFERHYLLESQPTRRKFNGFAKGGMYAYPHALCHGDSLYVIYSLWKEDVYVLRIPLADL